ncbi:YtzI protein [Lentibacillus sp. N15]
MLGYTIVGILIILIVLLLTLVSISKGYAYKHTIDPMPQEKEASDQTKSG